MATESAGERLVKQQCIEDDCDNEVWVDAREVRIRFNHQRAGRWFDDWWHEEGGGLFVEWALKANGVSDG